MEYGKMAGILSEHRILNIRIGRIRTRFPRFMGKNGIKGDHGFGVIATVVEIETDKGALGWGEFPPQYTNCDSQLKQMKGMCLTDMFDPSTGVRSGFEAFDYALHDLAAKILDMPVYRMIAAFSSKRAAAVPALCYDGAIYMNDIGPDRRPGGMAAVLSSCDQDWAAGYRAFKIKVGRGGRWMDYREGLDRDTAVVEMIRRHYPDTKLMVDFNNASTVEYVLEFVRRTAGAGIFWIEEPFQEAREPLLRLRVCLEKYSPTTWIADGESSKDMGMLLSLANEGLLNVLMPDISGYGFTAWRNDLPGLAGCPAIASPHAWGLKMKTHYAAHLAMAYPNVGWLEGILDETEGVDFTNYHMIDGYLSVPDKSGFGMDLNWYELLCEY